MPSRNVARQKHIFAINASPDYLNVLHEGLQEQGFSVTATNFVPKSFDQIVALQPDAVIVDVAVGERSGWDLLERLPAEAATSGIPVLITSTDPRLLDRARERAARYATLRSLDHPFDVQALLALLREMIETG
jgi:DNA-binding response OmpR family regulator